MKLDASELAKQAQQISHVSLEMPCYTRQRVGKSWQYLDHQQRLIEDKAEIARLNSIGLPPAYEKTWFCTDPFGHIQACGFDARGRRQYRYHPAFRFSQETEKFDRCADFGIALPKLRARVALDLGAHDLNRDRIIAAVVRLLDLSKIRVGNEAYASTNKSYGATTLRTNHVKAGRNRLEIEFRGKSGKMHKSRLVDSALLRVVRKCQDLPGQHLFQYLDSQDVVHHVTSSDVNAYIREATHTDFTAKHFRTWSASVIALGYLIDCQKTGETMKVTEMAKAVSAVLGNTPAIARKSYIHPQLIDIAAAAEPLLVRPRRATRWMLPHERQLIDVLQPILQA